MSHDRLNEGRFLAPIYPEVAHPELPSQGIPTATKNPGEFRHRFSPN
jgi:hypothetical protein